MHPYVDQSVLLDVLLVHEGSVEKSSESLRPQDLPPKKLSGAIGYQSSLSNFVDQKDSVKRAKLLSKKGKTLHLYDPVDVAAHTPCSIIHNFLPSNEANALLEELLREAATFERMSFKLFDNVVQSPHTTCFYVESSEEMQMQKTEYIYNGALLEVSIGVYGGCAHIFSAKITQDVRQLTPQMRRVSPKVEAAVNNEIQTRIKAQENGIKLKYQSPSPWKPNAAVVNCYNGGGESVGYHSDQFTYLGPRAVIGSISLGVAREFRVRRIVPQDSDTKAASKTKEECDLEGQIAIHLPHNSLLVMHAEMQEEWKHSISPSAAIDPHPIAGNRRINITYRHYKESLHPKFTPKCRCDVPAVFRVVQRKKENWGKYVWMCHAGNVPEKA